ncbi:arsenate reductase/protein-tyrosine-phosphatase family protein [Pantoea cypripedii]|uniref:protein-tyrosine-phosphatase n=1 Tax=Pantoea cypripedii TaxID=55209 RepID=A0A6B9GF74_PANCY|nr:protein tyrosine phosphatase [Pantoea cypripedii]QGY32289.1 protein tyrosine phosphatase [Pantoea cypripedii]
MFDSILVVCTGNICRSPTAERRLRQLLPGKKIDSAGVNALVGSPADEVAARTAGSHEVNLDGHKGQQFTKHLGRQYDLILVMEKRQIEYVTRIAPEARGKTMLIGHWLQQKEIPDPYLQSQEAFDFVYQLIERACQTWAIKLGG